MSILAQNKPESTHPSDIWGDDRFSEHVHSVRTMLLFQADNITYWKVRKNSKFIPGGKEMWYGHGPYYVKLKGEPGSLAWNIMSHKADLPKYNCDLEITENDVRETGRKTPPVEEEDDPDLEDCTEEIAKLPLIEFDAEKHFAKAPTYKQEICYLLRCRGSSYIVQLLGRSEERELVFPKFKQSFMMTVMSNRNQGRIQNIKRWMLEVIEGVEYLHSRDIVHRDLTMRNILDSGSSPLVICDLQCLHASHQPFEIDDGDYSKFSPASDVFGLGGLLWECCFYNHCLNRHVMLENPPPPPFRDIFVACTEKALEDRPTLSQLKAMFEAIEIEVT